MKSPAWLSLHWPLAVVAATVLSSLIWPIHYGWMTRLALGWDVGVALFLIVSSVQVSRTPSTDQIRTRAAALDQAGPAVLPLALLAGATSVGVVVAQAIQQSDNLSVLALATVALSWLFVHVIFAFHYAHAFYSRAADGTDCGGLEFPGEQEPDYWDFLHFALIIGVASQTADIQIASRRMRRTASVHCLTAFVFNTVVLALAVNTAVGLLG
ncbi:DUF1345 domain-containing protein [Brevundimonas sp. Root1279]|uniref:DUF1345 domain-containing protein n=1 Tax=Brevundimonas sp. Root1279 TaxID=1736443 RepID=UPI0006F8E870|nr:DUF1345 domain-containing protein [Brevundimonas sp. Root1279]KQW82673.1 hypothetical protein ASC65_08795 [Brevundimonas sp. Root1279]